MQFFQLVIVYRCRGIDHHIATRIVFWEGDKVTNRFLSAKDCDQSIQPKSNSSVRWCAILKSVHQKSELSFCFFRGKTKKFKHLALGVLIVNSDGTTSNFISV